MAELKWKTGKMAKMVFTSMSRVLQAGRGEMIWKKQEDKKDNYSIASLRLRKRTSA